MATLLSTERDRISELPDDILLSIISPMAMKEAAKTSIVSKRWRYLWAKRTHLDFDHLIILPECPPRAVILDCTAAQKIKYVNWVNQVVGLHCGPCIDTFKVLFPFRRSDAHHIDKWVRFALSKKVKNLELEFLSLSSVYTIGFDTILSPGDSTISCLMCLRLTEVDVSGDFLEYLLSRCCLLECLYVECSNTLVSLKVVSSKLKQLTIYACFYLEEVVIEAAVNLIYFECVWGNPSANLVFRSVPLLVEAVFHGTVVLAFSVFHKNSHVSAQISKLSLDLTYQVIPVVVDFPTFGNVRKLNLQVTGEMELDLVGITCILKACPVLHELKLEISWFGYCLESDTFIEMDAENQGKSHPNLKVLHVVGFNGWCIDVDLILYFVCFARNLETIICDSSRCCIYEEVIPEVIEASRSRAGKLAKIIPPKINVEIL